MLDSACDELLHLDLTKIIVKGSKPINIMHKALMQHLKYYLKYYLKL